MKEYKISQIPVKDIHGFVGSINESVLLHNFIADKNIADSASLGVAIKLAADLVNVRNHSA